MAAASPAPSAAQAIALGAKYGPNSALAFQRSQYLADALQAMEQSAGQNIRTPTALWSNLLADGILSYSKSKADKKALEAYSKDQADQYAKLIAGTPLDPSTAPPTVAGPSTAPPVMSETPPSGPPAPVFSEKPSAPADNAVGTALSKLNDPQGRDALARMMLGEAGGEGDQGMIAAGQVAMNRLHKGYGGAKSLADVINAPHQFEGLHSPQASVPPTDPHFQHAATLADQIMGGGAPDPTGGAINFLNPDLQAQLGRAQPAWATGQGQRIGHHVFYGGNPQLAQATPPPPPPPDPNGPPVQAAPQPYQVASNGPTPPPPMPPAPPQGPVPQGGAGAPLPPQGAPAIPHQVVTPEQWQEAQRLYADPRTRDLGIQEIIKLRMQAASPVGMKPGTYWGADGKPHSVEHFTDQPGAPNAFVQRSDLDNSIHAQANPAYGALPPGTVMGPQGGISQVPIQQQQTFKIPGVAGRFVTGPDGRPVKVGEDEYGPEQLFGLRRQVLESEAYKNYQQAQDAYGSMVAAAQQPNGGMRAYALRDTFARAINPGAVARVGTIQAIHDAQGVPASIKGFFMNLQGDGNVPPEIAQQILDVTRGFVASHYAGAKALNDSNADYARRHHIDPADVTAPMGEAPARFVIPSPTAQPGVQGGNGQPGPAAASHTPHSGGSGLVPGLADQGAAKASPFPRFPTAKRAPDGQWYVQTGPNSFGRVPDNEPRR